MKTFKQEALLWGNPAAADKVKMIGKKIGEMKTPAGNAYTVYKYGEYIVQIHQDDGEIILVMNKDKIEWVHPRDEEKLRRIHAIASGQVPTPTHAEQSKNIKDIIRGGGRK